MHVNGVGFSSPTSASLPRDRGQKCVGMNGSIEYFEVWVTYQFPKVVEKQSNQSYFNHHHDDFHLPSLWKGSLVIHR